MFFFKINPLGLMVTTKYGQIMNSYNELYLCRVIIQVGLVHVGLYTDVICTECSYIAGERYYVCTDTTCA